MKTTILFLILLLALSALAGWTRTYGGSSYDYGESVAQTSDGGYIVAGYTYSFGAGGYDVYLVKTDAVGDTIWTRTYGGFDVDFGYSVAQTSDGGYIVAGETYSFGAGGSDVYIVKTDAVGDTLWTRTYGGSDYDYGRSVAQTSDGGYIVAGYTGSFGAGSRDVYLVKTDAVGDTIWTRTYGGSDNDYGNSVAQTSDGGYIVAGGTESFGAGSYDIYLVKTDGLGDTIWTRTYGGSDDDYGLSVAQTSDGGYIVAGVYDYNFGTGTGDVYLVKTDGLGDTLWTRTYGGSSDDRGYSVAQTSDGGYIVAGVYDYDFGTGTGDVYLVKTDAVGDTLWTRTYGGRDFDWGNSVAQTSDGGYIVAGFTHSFGAGGLDIYLVKTDAVGDTIWTRTYGGSRADWGYSVAQTSDGGYIVAGYTESFGAGGYDVYLVKTDSLGYTGIEENSPSAKPEAFAISAHPNPFNSAVTITAPAGAEIEVFDINGRRVEPVTELVEMPGGADLPSTSSGSGSCTVVWQPHASLGSGVYLVRATVGEQSTSKRVVYLK